MDISLNKNYQRVAKTELNNPVDTAKLRESFDRLNDEAIRRGEERSKRMREYLNSLTFETYLISYIPGKGVVTEIVDPSERRLDVKR